MSNIRCRNNGVRDNHQPPSGREGDRRRVPGNALARFWGSGDSGGRSSRNSILALVKSRLVKYKFPSF